MICEKGKFKPSSPEELFKLIEPLSLHGKMKFIHIFKRALHKRITQKQAVQEIELLLLKYKLIEYPEVKA